MKIGIIATHSFPIPYPNLHTGDQVILNLAKALQSLGHDVTMYAPAGTDFNNLKIMPASLGKYPPSSEECELQCYNSNIGNLYKQDIIHDFSVTKQITKSMNDKGFISTCCTLMGGRWTQEWAPHNLIVWSKSHQDRVSRGATDYENMPTPLLGGEPGKAIDNVDFVYGGVDTDFYTPTEGDKDYFLWMGRWHPVRGYKLAIEFAKHTGLKVVLAGEHPDNEIFEYQKNCALEAEQLVKGASNIELVWLPKDPDHHTAKRELYRNAKAFLYTVQFHEPFGLSQAEAMACGTPVIGPKFGSVPEVVEHRKTGYIIDNDVQGFHKACKFIHEIKRSRCRERAVNHFDCKIMAKSYLEKYQNIISKSK